MTYHLLYPHVFPFGCSIHLYKGNKVLHFLTIHIHHGMLDNKFPMGIKTIAKSTL